MKHADRQIGLLIVFLTSWTFSEERTKIEVFYIS